MANEGYNVGGGGGGRRIGAEGTPHEQNKLETLPHLWFQMLYVSCTGFRAALMSTPVLL